MVPVRALTNPILFKALIAFSACHQSRVNGKFKDLAKLFHTSCVMELLAALEEARPLDVQGDYLSATCLLHSYEILDGKWNINLRILKKRLITQQM